MHLHHGITRACKNAGDASIPVAALTASALISAAKEVHRVFLFGFYAFWYITGRTSYERKLRNWNLGFLHVLFNAAAAVAGYVMKQAFSGLLMEIDMPSLSLSFTLFLNEHSWHPENFMPVMLLFAHTNS